MTANKKVAIIQPNYIPWKGYFDIIRAVDEFILLDDVQYTQRDWRNRNLIKTPTGLQWLSIPVVVASRQDKIVDVIIADQQWKKDHWNKLVHNYSKAPFFNLYKERFEKIYFENNEYLLSNINCMFIQEINKILKIDTVITSSSSYLTTGSKTLKLLNLCKAAGANKYISGPSAKKYLDETLLMNEEIEVEWFDYTGYKEYPQLFPPFEHTVTILDLLFNTGPEAINFMKSKTAQ